MNLLAQIYSTGLDIKGLAVTALMIIAVIVLIGVVLSVPAVQKYSAWVPGYVWSILGLLALFILAFWALGVIR